MSGVGDWSPLLLDIGTIALMLAVLLACFIVYRRLEAVRASQRDLGELVERLERAGATAQAAVDNLRGETSRIGERLEERIVSGRDLKEELTVIVESGTALAARLEVLLTERRREVLDELRTPPGSAHAQTDHDAEALPPARVALLDALKEAR